jgi:hypothetical protein
LGIRWKGLIVGGRRFAGAIPIWARTPAGASRSRETRMGRINETLPVFRAWFIEDP